MFLSVEFGWYDLINPLSWNVLCPLAWGHEKRESTYLASLWSFSTVFLFVCLFVCFLFFLNNLSFKKGERENNFSFFDTIQLFSRQLLSAKLHVWDLPWNHVYELNLHAYVPFNTLVSEIFYPSLRNFYPLFGTCICNNRINFAIFWFSLLSKIFNFNIKTTVTHLTTFLSPLLLWVLCFETQGEHYSFSVPLFFFYFILFINFVHPNYTFIFFPFLHLILPLAILFSFNWGFP